MVVNHCPLTMPGSEKNAYNWNIMAATHVTCPTLSISQFKIPICWYDTCWMLDGFNIV